jgi:hypothetical protein
VMVDLPVEVRCAGPAERRKIRTTSAASYSYAGLRFHDGDALARISWGRGWGEDEKWMR